MSDRERGGLLRKRQRELPDQNDGRVHKNGKRSVLIYAGETAADPRVRAQQRPFAVRPTAGNVGEDGKDRQLVVVVPKDERIVPEKNEAKESDERASPKRREKVVALEAFHANALQNNRRPFREEQHSIVDALRARRRHQTSGWFVERFVTETETAVVHRDQSSRAQFEKRLNGFLGIHVNLAAGRCVVPADRQERDLDIVAFADFLEAVEVSAIAAMKNRAAIHLDNEAAEDAVKTGEKRRAPMRTRRQRDFDRSRLHRRLGIAA